MKIIKNEKLIKRNAKLGQAISLGALAILGIGMYISFQQPELFSYSLASLLIGFTLTQVGMYLGSRFGRSPRPDERLDAGLKGLPGDFTLHHYTTPVSHLLIGPAGIWVLMPHHQRGTVSFSKDRWRMSGGGFFQGYLRIFGQESLGRPELEADSEIRALKKHLAKHMDESEIPPIQAALVFTNGDVVIEASDSSIPALKLKQLKDFLRQKVKERIVNPLSMESIKSVFAE